jgi:hypothetical protein
MVTKNRLATIPNVETLKKLCQSLATLDAIISPEWDYRYYSFNSKWASAPKELKEPYEKMSPAPNWEGLAAKILQSVRNFKGFSPEQMKAIKAEVFISAGDHNDAVLRISLKCTN